MSATDTCSSCIPGWCAASPRTLPPPLLPACSCPATFHIPPPLTRARPQLPGNFSWNSVRDTLAAMQAAGMEMPSGLTGNMWQLINSIVSIPAQLMSGGLACNRAHGASSPT